MKDNTIGAQVLVHSNSHSHTHTNNHELIKFNLCSLIRIANKNIKHSKMSTSIVKCARRVSAHGKENRLFAQHIRIKRIQKTWNTVELLFVGEKKRWK